MNVKNELIEIFADLFMVDISNMMDVDFYDAGILDSLATVELTLEIEAKFDIRVPVSEIGRNDWNTGNKVILGIEGLMND
ncbi:D-alanine--poly(phosphoribitol) ligase subunit DltC [Weissella coleopterorum]|uniref:D-alanyl carrier protein n=1 Tax=Weissella coleopterorum TaxID=2714949 RepID=A0A6G8B0H5_9LACO|nr:D-alanine--poly(phosphoribitol) ligase subunit DltC [Weissella coleopterorum]QIL50756.1 D-alanine--poly(phosphoribitol) ligase subunit DltC [Weissella coleopterorum]